MTLADLPEVGPLIGLVFWGVWLLFSRYERKCYSSVTFFYSSFGNASSEWVVMTSCFSVCEMGLRS